MPPRLVTVVVGAGPAGLLFAVIGRILLERASLDPGTWELRIFDKRETYARTHRLRMAPAAYEDAQRVLDDPRFDSFVAWLREEGFRPEVNVLEEKLLGLAREVGCHREVRAIGDEPGQTSLVALRGELERSGALAGDTLLTVVGADSVHSAVREAVRGDVSPVRHTHEQLARIRVEGEGLPTRLGEAGRLRLAKVLGSVVDYRMNRNGYAEVDLFLGPREHASVQALGATPKAPVPLSAAVLGRLRAPLFRAIIEHLEHGPEGRRRVSVLSTFRLEHVCMPKLTFEPPALGAPVFLLGDAGVSLPFQRGMSCLARCASILASIHVGLAAAPTPAARTAEIARYDREAAAVVAAELRIVRNQARLARTLKEIIRLSALLPFPIQSWWLSEPQRRRSTDHLSIWFFANLAVAVVALGVVFVGSTHESALVWAALPVETLGGVLYHAAIAFEGRRLVRRVWEVQIAAALLVGAWLAWSRWTNATAIDIAVDLSWWLLLAAAFVAGLYAFEAYVHRWFARAGLRFEEE